ncbi:clathrin-coated vesicle protein [Russula aff. rugulosa BPL654]|nr:clathrin-coated vesicle protein [Russula aff. rugulosa BPL654]
MFDTLIACLKIASAFKAPADRDQQKIASLYCIGELMGSLGTQVMSFMTEIATVAIKTYKLSGASPISRLSSHLSPISLRYHAVVALQKSLSTARRAASDAITKDIIKQMRSALNDKSLPVRRAACEVLMVMYPLPGGDWTASEIESVVSLCVKSLDSADQITRHSLAQLVGLVLSSSQAPAVVPPPEPKKNKKEDEEDDPASIAPSTGETKPIMSPNEMLHQLSMHFNKPQTTHKTRVGIFDFYAALFTTLGPTFVETNYGTIIQHLMSEVVNTPRNSATRYEILFIRRLVGIILRDLIGVRMLGEQSQIAAIQELSKVYLKRWPALMPGSIAPTTQVLTIVLREVAGLLQQLGNAPPPVQDALAEPLVTLLAHPNHTVRIHTAWALRIFCFSAPLRLPKIVIDAVELLQRDINLLASQSQTQTAPSDLTFRTLGHAYGLAALVTVIPERPLYVSYDISAKVLDMAITLLKRTGEHTVALAGVEVETAWMCIAALMTLGPNFVRAHLPQLLVLWRNALPKPPSKDTAARTAAEWGFLLHVREVALGAILAFLRHNSPALVTLDVARRLTTLLSNAFLFANAYAAQAPHVEDPLAGPENSRLPNATSDGPTLRSREALLRRRVFQCFTVLGAASVPEATQTTLLQSVISLVASAEGFAGNSVQAAIASSSGSFSSLWTTLDGYAYGVTGVEVFENASPTADHMENPSFGKYRLNRDSVEASIDDMLRMPILQSAEHDPLWICQSRDLTTESFWPEFPPPLTQVVDAALALFARLLPLQDSASAGRLITFMIDSVKSPKYDKNIGRKAAVQVNAAIAILLAIRQAMTSPSKHVREVFGSTAVTTPLSSFLKDGLVDGDPILRSASSEALGRLASLADNQFLATLMKTLVDLVVNNRDPQARAGCTLALGAIYDYVGSLAAGPLLKTTVNILMSLGKDAHPVVHYWALHSLSRVVNAASLAYAPYVPSTLGMLFKVYVSPSHELEGGTLSNSNISGDLPAYQALCQIIDAVITILGPDIQESTRTRTLILDIVRRLASEEDEGIRVEAIRCIQHFLMFVPEHIDVPELITQFRTHLNSSRRPLKLASIHALYQLVQKDALLISKVGGDRLVEELFAMLDGDPSIEGVRNVISSWMKQTVVYNPSAWIDLCQKIMSRTTASQQATDATKSRPVFDDEGESLSVGMTSDSTSGGQNRPTSRWRTQLFALQCLHDICITITRSGRREQLDIVYARSLGLPVSGLLASRVPDLIKMAFTASTAYVTEIRLEGLIVLRDVIETFALTPDPDYENALLLEQHQAPITAALTPAFTSDTTPELLASAVGACSAFVGCGVVKDLLTSALAQCSGNALLSLGDAAEGSPNASAMLRIAILSAWAQLTSASSQQKYLQEVVKPHKQTLTSLWIAALRDYASIRGDSEALLDTSTAPLDAAYASLGKDILLPYYAESWPVMLNAVATAMETRDPFVLRAMEGIDDVAAASSSTRSTGPEPTTMFFVIFGLVYEALSASTPYSESSSEASGSTSFIALRAMRHLVRREYSGRALLEPTIFDELINLWYRMAMTEPPALQIQLVEVIRVFSIEQGQGSNTSNDTTSPPMVCLRICAYILKNAIPSAERPPSHNQSNLADRVTLIKTSFDGLLSIGLSFDARTQEEVRAVAISLYSDLLRDESSEIDVVGPTLPVLKSLLTLGSTYKVTEFFQRVVHGLLSSCMLNIDEMRGREGSISTNKVKNNFLAAVLILTVIPPSVKVGQGVINRCCFLIAEKLSDAHEMAATAAHCAKTLITASASGSVMLRQCIRMLLPGMVEYVAKVAGMVADEAAVQSHLPAVGEIIKAFGTLFTNIAEELRVRVLGILLPTLTLLLDPNLTAPSPLHTQALNQLLIFASSSPVAFKEATGKLDQGIRERLESAVRNALSNKSSSSTAQQTAKPQISLRSF